MAYKCKIRESPRGGSRISEINVIPTDSKKFFQQDHMISTFIKRGKRKYYTLEHQAIILVN